MQTPSLKLAVMKWAFSAFGFMNYEHMFYSFPSPAHLDAGKRDSRVSYLTTCKQKTKNWKLSIKFSKLITFKDLVIKVKAPDRSTIG